MPAYTDYVVRGKIPEATSNLATKRVQMEQFFQDNLTYAGAPACNTDSSASQYFTFSCSAAATATAGAAPAPMQNRGATTGSRTSTSRKKKKKRR